nr:DNA topoisomerase II large subunit [Caudoviricetes sp.]
MAKYNSDSIKVLSDIEHIRRNPGIYIGDIDTPHHLLQECIDNSVDEAMNGYSDGFEVHVSKTADDDMVYSVVDYGRGIPAGYKTINDKKLSILEVITTKSNSGGKFDNNAYLNSAGVHGLGIKCVNALADKLIIESVSDGMYGTIQLENAEVVNKVEYKKTTKHSGTKITFLVSKNNKYFANNQIPFEFITNKLNTYQAFGIKNIKLFLNNEDVTSDYITATSPFDLHKHPMDNRDNALVVDCEVTNSLKERFRLSFNYISASSTSYKFNGYTNYLYNKDGGGHILAAQNAIVKAFDNFCQSRNIQKPSNMSSDYFIGLNCIVSCNIINKSFASQTKDKLVTGTGTTRNYFDELSELLVKAIEEQFNKHVGIVKAIVQRIADYRKEREARKELKGLSQYITINQSTDNTVRRGSVYEKLTECSSKNRDECELIMTEGNSASGSLIRTRNKQTTAVLPLRGKIKNVVGCSITDCLKNKEIAGVISTVGTGILNKCDINRIRYSNIIYLPDADIDGMHITNLVIALFVTLMPEVVKAGKLKIALSPLYGYQKNKQWYPAYKFENLPKDVQKSGKFERYKGIGSYSDEQVKTYLLDKNNRQLVTVQYPDEKNLQEFNHIMSTSEGKRNLLTGLGILKEV